MSPDYKEFVKSVTYEARRGYVTIYPIGGCSQSDGRALLLITFDSGVEKIYDCGFLLARPQFRLLASPAVFNAVSVDP